jgi:hypothetical protein
VNKLTSAGSAAAGVVDACLAGGAAFGTGAALGFFDSTRGMPNRSARFCRFNSSSSTTSLVAPGVGAAGAAGFDVTVEG